MIKAILFGVFVQHLDQIHHGEEVDVIALGDGETAPECVWRWRLCQQRVRIPQKRRNGNPQIICSS
jgi:hypothetical protein